MNYDAQVLLRNQKLMESRLSVIQAKLMKADTLRKQLNDEVIQAMAYAQDPLDGQPMANGTGSRTEYVALHYQERLLNEQKEREREVNWLRVELAEVEEQIALHDAVLRSLNEAELLLVWLHYNEGFSFSRIAETNKSSDVPWKQSVNTMKRMNSNILRKVNDVLQPFFPAASEDCNSVRKQGFSD